MISYVSSDEVRKTLIASIAQSVKDLGIKQVDLAPILGLTQPRLSNLLCGKYEMFTIDALLDVADKAGLQFHYQVTTP
jgi:predicted XRE-type DNA-binding protein